MTQPAKLRSTTSTFALMAPRKGHGYLKRLVFEACVQLYIVSQLAVLQHRLSNVNLFLNQLATAFTCLPNMFCSAKVKAQFW